MFDSDDEESSLETRTVPELPDVAPDVPDSTIDVPDDADAPTELKHAFWTLVGVLNAGMLALALGVMLVGFRGWYGRGGALAGAGALALAYGYWRYRCVTADPTWSDHDADGT